MLDFPIYDDIDSPLGGLMFLGHDVDPKADDVRGQIIQSITDAASMAWVFEARPDECGAVVAQILALMEARNDHCRHKILRCDDDGNDLPDVHFGLTGDIPDEHDGNEENCSYDFCSATNEFAQAVTVFDWSGDVADEANAIHNNLWSEEVAKKLGNKGQEGNSDA